MLSYWNTGEIKMDNKTKRTTVYLEPDLHKALRLKSATISRSVSDLINEAVRESLAEDAEDLEAFMVREAEPLVSYEDMIKRLQANGRI
jgi:hypothetical protein